MGQVRHRYDSLTGMHATKPVESRDQIEGKDGAGRKRNSGTAAQKRAPGQNPLNG